MGLPVFSPIVQEALLSCSVATAGYLWAYPVVAFVAGWMAERGVISFARNLVAGTMAELVLFAGGIGWLAIMMHSWQRAAFFGLYPFLFAEVMKVMVAAGVASRLRRSF